MNILYVEDNPDDRILVELILNELGHSVVLLKAAKHALEYIETATFDLVILDIIMEDQEGIETLTKIKKHHPDTRVAMLSGSHFYFAVAELLGADKCIIKDSNFYSLQQYIHELSEKDK